MPEKSPSGATAPAAMNPYARPPEAVREPPKTLWGRVRFLGPSFILIGSIVGSGELILTVSLGAEVGFIALWFIIMACVVKTIVQAELGRYVISSGDTCLEAFNRLPGPRARVGWFIWLWVLWQIPGIINGGAILGSTGQVLSVAFPFAEQRVWALVIAVVNVLLLLIGRYRFLERVSLVMVISFSLITVFGAVSLQFQAHGVSWTEALNGLVVRIQPLIATGALSVLLAAFSGTGVSGGELMSYTYWCVEKGYARFSGVNDGTPGWVERARGWIKVMQLDVWLATAIFTLTTIAFYWLGAGILHPQGLNPKDADLVVTLQRIYTGSLGPWSAALFLVGAFFVLYSTLFSGTAGGTRMYADALGVFKLVDFTDFRRRMLFIRLFTVVIPLIQTVVFALSASPKSLLVVTAVTNGMLIPVISFATIWLRYRGTDPAIRPGKLTDLLLWVCSTIILIVCAVFLVHKTPELLSALGLGTPPTP